MKKKKKSGSGSGLGCLGAPMRALSRACDSACNLYVRGVSRCARGLPPSAAGAVGRGFAGSSAASSLHLRVSSDKADDLLFRAAAAAASSRRQRRVAAEPEPAVCYGAGRKQGSAGGLVGSAAAPGGRAPSRKRAVVATMGTIAEDAPCEFGADDGAAPPAVTTRAVYR